MRRALVLSSGGAKSSWQVGACQHLITEGGYWFDVISGVSAGAINGAALAHAHDRDGLRAHLERLRSVWLGFRGNQDIYRRRRLGALGLALGKWNSLYDTTPLRELLAREIDPPKLAVSPIRLRVGYVDLRSGRYVTAGNDHPFLLDAVMASSSLPLVFPPIPVGDGRELGVDGAVRHATPLTDAVCALAELPPDGDPPEVWVLLLHPPGKVPATDAIRKWFGIAFRSLSFDTDEVLTQRPRGAHVIPSRSAGPLCERYPRVRVRVLQPARELKGSVLDFRPSEIRAWYQDGLETARHTKPLELPARVEHGPGVRVGRWSGELTFSIGPRQAA